MELKNEQEEQLQWKACGICHIGKIRGNNEDNLLFCGKFRDELTMPIWESNFAKGSDDSIFAVLDGMGGESHGEWASLVGVQTLGQLEKPSVAEICACLQEINLKICEKIKTSGTGRIGSTVVIAKLAHNHVDFINLGDSRAYVWDNETLIQWTSDHTEYQSHLNMGFTEEELRKQNISQGALTQHLGIFPQELLLEPQVASTTIREHHKILLCSDGLSGMVSHQEMTDVFKQELAAKQTAHKLLQLALDHGGKDNITIEVLEFSRKKT